MSRERGGTMPNITPFLWFDDKAEEAANFYVSIFPNSKIESASSTSVTFELEGQKFYALNGGPHYTLTPAVSFFVDCETQHEVDELWNTLLEGGEPLRCGWITDKFGLTWQIIPKLLGEMLQDDDDEKSQRVMQAMLQMVKIDVAGLQRAYDGV